MSRAGRAPLTAAAFARWVFVVLVVASAPALALQGTVPQEAAPQEAVPQPSAPAGAAEPAAMAAAPGQEPAQEPTAPGAKRATTHADLVAALEALTIRHDANSAAPTWELPAIGASLSGRRLRALTLGQDVPAVAVCAHPALGLRGARDVLALMRLCGATPDPRREVAWIGVPQLLPDAAPPVLAAPPGDPRGAVDIERDFPAAWLEGRMGGDARKSPAGPYPLSRPESDAIARFLADRPRLAALVQLVPAAPDANEPVLRAAAGEPGSLLRFAHEMLGVATWELVVPPGDLENEHLQTAVQKLLDLARGLPRLRLDDARAMPLGDGLWQIDLVLFNAGTLPTASGRGRAGQPESRIALRAGGVPTVGAAAQTQGGDYLPLKRAGARAEWRMPPLEAGGKLPLRWVVRVDAVPTAEGDAAAPRLVLEAHTATAFAATLTVELR